VTRYAGFLRAVNVGGNNKVPMATLREIATDAGYTDVATYVQSGNLALAATVKAAMVEKKLHDGIAAQLGLDIDVMVRSRAELAKVIDANPFPDRVEEPTRLHVSFLAGKPTAAAIKACDPEEFLPEEFAFGDRCLYLWYPDGAGRSKLATAPWAKRLGVRGTGRNWRTVTKMLAMLD
jgi:uncharacterized protein (DUF1697 family)